jgi:hypothetical protein
MYISGVLFQRKTFDFDRYENLNTLFYRTNILVLVCQGYFLFSDLVDGKTLEL